VQPSRHFAFSAALGLAISPWLGVAGGLGCLLGGTLIDVDHVADYVLDRGGWQGRPAFERYFYGNQMRRLVLVLHGFDLLLIAGLALVWIGPRPALAPWLWGAWLGASLHLLCDWWSNPLRPGGYFFLFRAFQGFRPERLLDPARVERQRVRLGLV